jgi:hypothetical protein
MANKTINGQPGAFAFEGPLTVTNSVKTLTATVYISRPTTAAPTRSAIFATISVESNSIRYTLDGTTPTTSVGHRLDAGDVLFLSSFDDIKNFQAIRISADAELQVTYA